MKVAKKRKIYNSVKEDSKNDFTQLLRPFLTTTTVHGLNHIFRQNEPKLGVVLWILVVILAFYGCFFISNVTLERYKTNPTVITMERDHLFWNTSFPAGTICPKYRIDSKKLTTFFSKNSVKNKTEFTEFIVSLARSTYKTFHEVPYNDDISSDKFMDVLIELMFDFDPAVSNSLTTAQNYQLQQTLTEVGICYSYNSQLAVYNSPWYWKSNRWNILNQPDILFVHPLDGEVFVNIVNMSASYNFYVHGPYETIDIASRRISEEDGRFLQVYLSGLTIFSGSRVRYLMPEQRKCRFYDESYLDHFPVYSRIQCRMECRISLAKRLCGCIPHFYRKIGNEKVCDVKGLHCLSRFSEKLISLQNECNCLPNCEEVNYVVQEKSSVEWFLGTNILWGFKEYPTMRLRRDVLFGFADFLVYIGAIVGLFFGCSMLSFIEIVYFFSIRLPRYLIRYKIKRNL